jgi:hypothetical protein
VSYTEAWFHAFIITIGVELVVAFPLLRQADPSWSRRLVAVFLANLASHPLVWFGIPQLAMPRFANLVVCEAWAIGVEVVFYQLVFRMRWVQALAVSALANGTSFGVGLLLRQVTTWI